MANKDLGIRVVTDNSRIVESDVLVVGNTASNITIYLPAADGTSKVYYVKNINTGVITILPDCKDTIDADTTVSLNQWDSVCIVDFAKTKWLKA